MLPGWQQQAALRTQVTSQQGASGALIARMLEFVGDGLLPLAEREFLNIIGLTGGTMLAQQQIAGAAWH